MIDAALRASLDNLERLRLRLVAEGEGMTPLPSPARQRWAHRLDHRRTAAARGGRIASAIGVLRGLPGYERVKIEPGRWAIFAALPIEGRVMVAELHAPTLGARNRAALVGVIEIAPMPAAVVAGLEQRAQRGTFTFTPRRARRLAEAASKQGDTPRGKQADTGPKQHGTGPKQHGTPSNGSNGAERPTVEMISTTDRGEP